MRTGQGREAPAPNDYIPPGSLDPGMEIGVNSHFPPGFDPDHMHPKRKGKSENHPIIVRHITPIIIRTSQERRSHVQIPHSLYLLCSPLRYEQTLVPHSIVVHDTDLGRDDQTPDDHANEHDHRIVFRKLPPADLDPLLREDRFPQQACEGCRETAKTQQRMRSPKPIQQPSPY